MKWLRVGSSLSLFGRTFLLMIAALAIAEAIGLTLLVTRPPIHNAPVALSELARELEADNLPGGPGGSARPEGPGPANQGGAADQAGPGGRAGHDGSGGPGPADQGGPGGHDGSGDRSGPGGSGGPDGSGSRAGPGGPDGSSNRAGPGGPDGSGNRAGPGGPDGSGNRAGPGGPDGSGNRAGPSGLGSPPGPGGGPGGPGGSVEAGSPGGPGSPEWNVRYSIPTPEPSPGSSLVAAPDLQRLLAQRLHVATDRVRMFVQREGLAAGPPPPPGRIGDPQLREGFLAAFRLDSGVWRIVESVVPGFPNEFQRQAMWLFALGMLLLLPLAWLFSRALVAPIQRFSIASQRLGSDTRAAPLPLDGPREMRAAIESFNIMQARLNRLLEERTHMIGAIAHDLRTPLTRLAFRLESLPPPLGDKVNADIQEMKAMISAALDFIRERSTGGRRERLDFRLLVESVVDDQTDVGNDVTLQEGDPIVLSGDATALRRMLVNLVENALKYGERARLRLKRQAQECTLEIDDDGPGIPESQRERVFQPFYRIETSRNRNTGGIGLGLATVRAIVLDHGGSIGLRNRPEGGLRVTVTIAAEATRDPPRAG